MQIHVMQCFDSIGPEDSVWLGNENGSSKEDEANC